MMSEEAVRALSADDRAELRALLVIASEDVALSVRALRRRGVFVGLSFFAVIGLVAWMFVLGFTLPSTSTTHAWGVTWIGLDVAEAIALAISGWAAWRGRHLLIPAALVTGTLLLCDAWFDMALSWGTAGFTRSVLTAVIIELPLAVLLWLIAFRLIRATLMAVRQRIGLNGPAPKLSSLALFVPMEAGPRPALTHRMVLHRHREDAANI
jgi:hypothetical protein